jgi:hypothetical protein
MDHCSKATVGCLVHAYWHSPLRAIKKKQQQQKKKKKKKKHKKHGRQNSSALAAGHVDRD